MTLQSQAFLSPSALSLDQVHQLLLLSIKDQHPEWDTQDRGSPYASYERKLGELAALFFGASNSDRASEGGRI